jgi:predicted porin
MNKRILLATSALIAGFASNASAVDVEMYGQANKGVLVYDDGRDTETNFVDNSRSSSRFGFRGSQALDNGLTASVLIEQELESTPSDELTQNTTVPSGATAAASTQGGSTGATLRERHTRVGLAGDWGAVFLGHTSTATDGITEIDLAGVEDVIGSNIEDIGGDIGFRRNTGALATNADASRITAGSVLNNMDGIRGNNSDRVETVRYDSPIFHGFQGRVAAAQGGDVDGAVLYNGKIDAFQIAAGAGYVAFNSNASTANNEIESQMSGSFSVKHDSGLALTAAYGAQEIDRALAGVDDPEFYYVKVGYAWDAFEVAADFTEHSDITQVAADTETTSYGVGGQYNMGHGVSLAALYRQIDLDRTGLNTDEVNLYGVNLRVKF